MSSKALNKGLTWGENITYSLGSLGRELSNNCINVFFLAYLNIYMGLNALVLTFAFVIAKIWDTVNDPLLATLVNNTKASKKWGKFRPWIAVGAVHTAQYRHDVGRHQIFLLHIHVCYLGYDFYRGRRSFLVDDTDDRQLDGRTQ